MRPSDPERLEALRELLVELCHRRGPIPFALYMELCLYHPELGYYTQAVPPMGPKGDYLTYPSVHKAFGHLLARQLNEIWELMDRPCPFTLVEMGGGKGELIGDILEALEDRFPEMLQALSLTLVDRSPRLLAIQRSQVGSRVQLRACAPEELFCGPAFTGCLFSNELLDAMPVHVVEMRQGRIMEVYVDVQQTTVQEVLAEPSESRILDYLEAFGPLVEGQRVEVGLAAVDWMKSVAAILERGMVITVDFGYSGHEAFHPLRSGGTLMAYRGHRASADPYELPGGQDLAAHVNFWALIQAGKEEGLQLTGLIPQDKFLLSLGLLEEMEAHESRRAHLSPAAFWTEKLALRRLMMPQPTQGGFQVLLQHKAWEPPPLMCSRTPDQWGLEPPGGSLPRRES